MPFHHTFRNPPAAYRIIPFWFWNSTMHTEEIVHQIQEMAEKGVGGFFICARQGLKIPYLSEQWFQLVAVAIQTAQRYGLEVWLYDEYPYPSGMSGGEVTLQHPDAKHRQLHYHTLTVDGSHTLSYELPWAKVLAAQAVNVDEATGEPLWSHSIDLIQSIGSTPTESVFQSTGLTKYTNKRFFTASLHKQLIWNVPPGRWLITIFLEKEIDEFKYFGTYVDPCHKEAIQTFLHTTHEQYAQRFQAHFGQTIKGFFTDEVGLLGRIPWSNQLPAFFREKYGYELLENLPVLLLPQGKKTAQLRYHFFQALHRLLGEVYHQQMGQWCERHQLQYLTEVPSMRMTTQMYSHIPGGDSAHEKVGRSLAWILDCNAYSLRANPKIASSLANQLGTERAMIECFHSVGWSMTLQDAKLMLDRLAALGINFFVFHAFFSSISGLRKHDAPPSQFLQNPYWTHFRQLADYAGRLGYAMSQGRACTSIAIVHPTTTFWGLMGNPFHNFSYCGNDETEERALAQLKQDWAYLCNQLLLSQVDYDHLDPELLAQATIAEGQLVLGQARYSVLILPPMTNLEAAAWSQIKTFLQAGGKVISVGLLPYEQLDQHLNIEAETLAYFGLTTSPYQSYWQGSAQQHAEPIETEQTEEIPLLQGTHAAYFIPTPGGVQRTRAIEQLLTLLQRCAPPTMTLEPVFGDLTSFLIQQRSLPDGSQLLFITHQEKSQKTLRVHLTHCPTRLAVERLDLASGELTTLPVEKTVQGWTIPLSFAPYESHLLQYTFQGETQEIEDAPLVIEQKQPWQLTLDVQQPWKVTAQQDNILRLGTFHFTIDRDEIGAASHWSAGQAELTWPSVEAKPLVNQCADIAAMHLLPIQFGQSFGSPLHTSLAYPLHCWYQTSFFVEQIPPTCKLVMDEDALGGLYTLYLNGQTIPMQDFMPIAQSGYQQQECSIQPLLKSGLNHLVIQLEAQQDEDGVRDPLYLRGPFGVSFAAQGMPTIEKQSEHGRLKSGIQEGYPYFAGTLCFTHEISIETIPREKTFILAFQGWDQHIDDCVEILVNDHSLGVCCWSPYHWQGESVLLHEGTNTIEIRITNTLNGMLEGTYFDPSSHQILPIEKHFDNRQ